jgi:aryl sulfotransferase
MNAIAANWPVKKHELVNGMVDSTRWNDFPFRDDDIVIATWSKSGTTLTQQIVGQLIFNGDPTICATVLSPWIDIRLATDALDIVAKQTHRRFLKTHLPVEALCFSPKAKYIYIGRDVRDVVWSWHNHAMGFTPEARIAMEAAANGFPIPPPPNPDIRTFYHQFLDGDFSAQPHPFWSHVQGWWNIRQLPNVLLLHFANLIDDLPKQIRLIAAFLDIPVDESQFERIVEQCRLEHTRKVTASNPVMGIFKDGANTFINKGTNGRWRDVLTQAEIAKSDAIAARELTLDCAEWLRTGVT